MTTVPTRKSHWILPWSGEVYQQERSEYIYVCFQVTVPSSYYDWHPWRGPCFPPCDMKVSRLPSFELNTDVGRHLCHAISYNMKLIPRDAGWIIDHRYQSFIMQLLTVIILSCMATTQIHSLPNFGLLCPRILIHSITAQQYSTRLSVLISLRFKCKLCHFVDVIFLFYRKPSQVHNYWFATLCPTCVSLHLHNMVRECLWKCVGDVCDCMCVYLWALGLFTPGLFLPLLMVGP